jgi:uncharacterized membrane protein YoaK (UPF0700 family)
MANVFYNIGKRLLISKSRGRVRGSIIFLLTHLLFIAGVIFTLEIALLMLGLWNIHVPLAGQIVRLLD